MPSKTNKSIFSRCGPNSIGYERIISIKKNEDGSLAQAYALIRSIPAPKLLQLPKRNGVPEDRGDANLPITSTITSGFPELSRSLIQEQSNERTFDSLHTSMEDSEPMEQRCYNAGGNHFCLRRAPPDSFNIEENLPASNNPPSDPNNPFSNLAYQEYLRLLAVNPEALIPSSEAMRFSENTFSGTGNSSLLGSSWGYDEPSCATPRRGSDFNTPLPRRIVDQMSDCNDTQSFDGLSTGSLPQYRSQSMSRLSQPSIRSTSENVNNQSVRIQESLRESPIDNSNNRNRLNCSKNERSMREDQPGHSFNESSINNTINSISSSMGRRSSVGRISRNSFNVGSPTDCLQENRVRNLNNSRLINSVRGGQCRNLFAPNNPPSDPNNPFSNLAYQEYLRLLTENPEALVPSSEAMRFSENTFSDTQNSYSIDSSYGRDEPSCTTPRRGSDFIAPPPRRIVDQMSDCNDTHLFDGVSPGSIPQYRSQTSTSSNFNNQLVRQQECLRESTISNLSNKCPVNSTMNKRSMREDQSRYSVNSSMGRRSSVGRMSRNSFNGGSPTDSIHECPIRNLSNSRLMNSTMNEDSMRADHSRNSFNESAINNTSNSMNFSIGRRSSFANKSRISFSDDSPMESMLAFPISNSNNGCSMNSSMNEQPSRGNQSRNSDRHSFHGNSRRNSLNIECPMHSLDYPSNSSSLSPMGLTDDFMDDKELMSFFEDGPLELTNNLGCPSLSSTLKCTLPFNKKYF